LNSSNFRSSWQSASLAHQIVIDGRQPPSDASMRSQTASPSHHTLLSSLHLSTGCRFKNQGCMAQMSPPKRDAPTSNMYSQKLGTHPTDSVLRGDSSQMSVSSDCCLSSSCIKISVIAQGNRLSVMRESELTHPTARHHCLQKCLLFSHSLTPRFLQLPGTNLQSQPLTANAVLAILHERRPARQTM